MRKKRAQSTRRGRVSTKIWEGIKKDQNDNNDKKESCGKPDK